MSRSALPESEISAFLSENPHWSYDQDALHASFKFEDFRSAFAFLSRIAFEFESHDHHAEIFNVYNRVQLKLTTHDVGNKVTATDLKLAGTISKLVP